MQASSSEEGLKLAKQLKETITIAVAMVMIKKARQEGISAIQYTKNFQEKYVRDHQEKLGPILRQRFLASCQDEVLEKLRKAIPQPCEPTKVCQNSESHYTKSNEAFTELDWWEETESRQEPKQPPPPLPPPRLYRAEDSAMRNVKFVESMLRLAESTEHSELISTSELHSLLNSETQLSRHHFQNLNLPVECQKLTEDSGFYSSECTMGSSTSHCVNLISSSVVRYNMQSLNSDQLMVQSSRLLVDYVKCEMKVKSFEVFCGWRQSLVEQTCDVLNRFARKNEDCSDMLQDLSLDLLEDIWHDKSTSQHESWEIKSYFVNNLLPAVENCYEILQYISEKCIIFRKALTKRSNEYSMLVEKLNVLLNLYCSVSENVQRLKAQNKEQKGAEKKPEDSEVTLLWREKWGKGSEEEGGEREVEEMLVRQIESFEVLVICLSHGYPLLAMLLLEAIEAAKILRSQCESSRDDDLL